jgi:hypothetical protein
MKKIIWLVGAMCAAAAGCLVLTSPRRIEPGEDPAPPHEAPWRDHRTVA